MFILEKYIIDLGHILISTDDQAFYYIVWFQKIPVQVNSIWDFIEGAPSLGKIASTWKSSKPSKIVTLHDCCYCDYTMNQTFLKEIILNITFCTSSPVHVVLLRSPIKQMGEQIA